MKFRLQANLKRHERTHTGEKPFECMECGNTFSEKTQLKRHNLIHTGENPHGCLYRDKSFRHENTLIRHERSHLNGFLETIF